MKGLRGVYGYGRGERCAYCKRKLEASTAKSWLAATRDHVKPKSRGGTYTVWACKKCNAIKGSMAYRQWLDFMDHNPGWWRLEFGRGWRHRVVYGVAASQPLCESAGPVSQER